MFAASLSVFHFRIRTSFQVPGFEWVHELLLLCLRERGLTSNSAQFCAEIACGKTGLGHNFIAKVSLEGRALGWVLFTTAQGRGGRVCTIMR